MSDIDFFFSESRQDTTILVDGAPAGELHYDYKDEWVFGSYDFSAGTVPNR